MGGTTRTKMAAAVILAVALSACTGGKDAGPSAGHTPMSTAGLEPFYDQKIDWRPCDGGLECGTVSVPLDYSNPGGEKISVAVNRRKASGKDRIGSLLINPGGPGASGVAAVEQGSVATKAVQDRYDIVGFDPRGVQGTAPIDCVSDKRLDAIVAMDATPETPAEEKKLAQSLRDLAVGCAEMSGKVLPHVGTRNTARDMDILRAALGEDKLNYLGYSYGTFLGALYADYFPDRAGRLVLDGAVNPAADDKEVVRAQAEGFQLALRSFVEDCLQAPGCPLTGTPDEAMAQIDKLLDDMELEPLPTGEERRVTQAMGTLGIAAGLYAKDTWPYLRIAFEDAINGQGDGLLALADAYTSREPDGYQTNLMEAATAIGCMDSRSKPTVPAVRELARELEQVSPAFGGFTAWSTLTCAGWQLPADGQPAPLRAPGAPPLLVVGTTRDPATPLRWAEAMAEQLESGVLLVREGDGHVAYQQGNACIDATIDAYLLEGTVPDDGKRCEA